MRPVIEVADAQWKLQREDMAKVSQQVKIYKPRNAKIPRVASSCKRGNPWSLREGWGEQGLQSMAVGRWRWVRRMRRRRTTVTRSRDGE